MKWKKGDDPTSVLKIDPQKGIDVLNLRSITSREFFKK
jgi:hypothetical protein